MSTYSASTVAGQPDSTDLHFAKVFTVGKYQVLTLLDINQHFVNEDDVESEHADLAVVVTRVLLGSAVYSMKIFGTEKAARAVFNRFDQASADALVEKNRDVFAKVSGALNETLN